MAVTAVDVAGLEERSARAPAAVPRAPDLGWLRELQRLPDSLLHAKRRRAARAQLRTLRPRSILFICHGNICRSPFAAAAFLRVCSSHFSGSIKVSSAGFIGPGRMPPGKALTAGSRHGIDISSHRSALATLQSLRESDLVVVMSSDQARNIEGCVRADTNRVLVLGDLDPLPFQSRTIPDPWGNSDAAFDASYERIYRCVCELAGIIGDDKKSDTGEQEEDVRILAGRCELE